MAESLKDPDSASGPKVVHVVFGCRRLPLAAAFHLRVLCRIAAYLAPLKAATLTPLGAGLTQPGLAAAGTSTALPMNLKRRLSSTSAHRAG